MVRTAPTPGAGRGVSRSANSPAHPSRQIAPSTSSAVRAEPATASTATSAGPPTEPTL